MQADLALRALADAEEIEVDESELDEEIVHLAEHARTSRQPKCGRRSNGADGLAGLRSQIRSAKALRWLVEHVTVVDDEGKPVDRSMLLVDEPDDQHAHEESATTRPDAEED